MQSSSSVGSDFPVFHRRISLNSLTSFTHNYSSPPPGYDDSEAGGGRTYFFRPLRFRCDETVAQSSPTPSPSPAPFPGARSGIAARRQGHHVSFFVYTDVNMHFSAALPVALAPRRICADSPATHTSPPSSSDDSLLLGLPDTNVDSPSGRSPIPLLGRDERLYGDPNFSSEDESDDYSYEWAGGNQRENPCIRTHWSSYAVTPALNRQPAIFSGESPIVSLENSAIPPMKPVLPVDEELFDARYEDDCIFRAREIPHLNRLFIPVTYTDTRVVNPGAAQAAGEERRHNQNGRPVRHRIDFTRFLARVLIACSVSTLSGSFLLTGFDAFWLNMLLIALIMS
ncbi:hypothetical protein F503_01299 [Ophiostoma piceae UAMH 11346]|uniref:Uncharacterized protein n=1 Tax=Ophiostoma piceae (strain UAMH 11346) TaxID=1262450 RepID=S3CUC2_OPHP1|nr:hypothetical protein F503_01299 [Ophiostoma piceae UAMH 11346]